MLTWNYLLKHIKYIARTVSFIMVTEARGGGILITVLSDVRSEVLKCHYLDLSFPNVDVLICKYLSRYIIDEVIYIPRALTAEAILRI